MKKIHIFLMVFSFITLFLSFLPTNNSISSNNNKETEIPYFKTKQLKMKDNNQYLLNIVNDKNYNLSFKLSDPGKVRIIESNNKYIKLEKVKNFTGFINIFLSIKGEDKTCDKLKIICFNEIVSINKITIYKKNEYIIVDKYEEGEYLIEFNLTKLSKSSPFEEDTLIELQEYLSINLSKDIKKSTYLIDGNLSYVFDLKFEYVFANSNYKTLNIKLNNAQYALTLEKSR